MDVLASERRMENSDSLSLGDGPHDSLKVEMPVSLSSAGAEVQAELEELGLTSNEARIYVHLVLEGSTRAGEVSKSLGIHRTETYNRLTALGSKGLVESTLSHPTRFVGIPLEKGLEMLLDGERSKLREHEKKRENVCQLMDSLPKVGSADLPPERIQVLQGIRTVALRSGEMLRNAEEQVCVLATESELARLYHQGAFDEVSSLKGREVNIRILCSTPVKGAEAISYFQSIDRFSEVRACSLRKDMTPSLILRDQTELVFLLNGSDAAGEDVSAFVTNYVALATAMGILFSSLWRSSKPVGKHG